MNWQDKGYLISKTKYSENSSIVEFYTKNYGKKSGIIYGSSSKKIRNYLLIGNKFHLDYSSKSENHLGYFKIEIDKITTPIFFEDKQKLFCIIFSVSLTKLLTVENQENKSIYNLLNDLFLLLRNDNWLINFIFWELNFYKCIGYDVNFKNYVKNVIVDGDEKFIVESTNKVVPNFLIKDNDFPKNINDIIKGFNIVGDFLDKTILKPNNINYPLSRIEFGNLIKLN